MTRDEAREFAKVVQAYADGAEIQYRGNDGVWGEMGNRDFWPPMNSYRIKPEPREWWIATLGNGRVTGAFNSFVDARFFQRSYPLSSIVNVREVVK